MSLLTNRYKCVFYAAIIENEVYICARNLNNISSMLSYIKKYPLSLCVIATVIYLSFFRPPQTGLSEIPYMDKAVHLCMYMGMSGILWLEFLRAHRKDNAPLWHAWIGAFLCPILFSGCVEILQEYCTDYRGGDWLDFAANATGALIASLVSYCAIRPRIIKKVPDDK